MNMFSWVINVLNFFSWEHDVLFFRYLSYFMLSVGFQLSDLFHKSVSSQAGLADQTEPDKWHLDYLSVTLLGRNCNKL